jgi:hypothetical protein
LAYLDLLRWYDTSNEIIKSSTYVTKTKRKFTTITKINCEDNHYSSDDTIVTKNEEIKTVFSINKNEVDSLDRLSFIPINGSYININGNTYEFFEPYEYTNAIEKSENERTDDEKKLIIEINEYKANIENPNNKNFIIINRYDEFLDINEKWNSWWANNYKESGWETIIFNGYITNPYHDIFKFCYDFETYILGLKYVYGEHIKGTKVPKFVYFTGLFNEKSWFEINSAKTITAYNEHTDDSKKIVKKWELWWLFQPNLLI